MDDSEVIAAAAKASELVSIDHERAHLLARQVVDETAEIDPSKRELTAAAATAHRVLTTFSIASGNVTSAETHIQRAYELAQQSEDDETLGAVLMTRMGVWSLRGDGASALRDADVAAGLLSGLRATQLAIQRGTILGAALGRTDDAIDAFDDVVASCDDLDPFTDGILRLNRGTMLLKRGDDAAASLDLRRANHLFKSVGNQAYERATLTHLLLVAVASGDLGAVFDMYGEINAGSDSTAADPRTLIDLSDALLACGLTHEAADLANHARAAIAASGLVAGTPELLLRLAETSLALGEVGRATELATEANGTPEGSDRTVDLRAQASLVRCSPSSVDGRDVARVCSSLVESGFAEEALATALAVTHAAIDNDRPDLARLAIGSIPKAHASTRPHRRSQELELAALEAVVDANPGLAKRRLSRSIDALDAARETTQADDLRAFAGASGARAAQFGLELALETAGPKQALEWAERTRATALELSQPSAELDPQQRRRLHELRQLEREGSGAVKDLEREVNIAARGRRRSSEPRRKRRFDVRELRHRLAGRTLVEFIWNRGVLEALVVDHRRVTRHQLAAPRNDIAESLALLDFHLRRIGGNDSRSTTAQQRMVAVLEDLSSTLLEPLRISSNEAVIVPAVAMQHLPWNGLPGLADIAFVIAPSARSWLRSDSLERSDTSMTSVAGPDLDHATMEAEAVAAIRDGHSVVGEAAEVDRVLACFEHASTLHVAAHGRVRFDSPQFSSLSLADGSLYVHDLARCERVPDIVVLSACDVGNGGLSPASELLGFPAALLARGVRSLIASTRPVEDKTSGDLMQALHGALAKGESPSQALATAAAATRNLSPLHWTTAMCFAVYGAS